MIERITLDERTLRCATRSSVYGTDQYSLRSSRVPPWSPGPPLGLAAIVTFIWMPLAVLDVSGVPVSAVVTAEHVVRGKHNLYQYEVRDLCGQPIAGVLTEYRDVYAVGDRVSVVVDPVSNSIRQLPSS